MAGSSPRNTPRSWEFRWFAPGLYGDLLLAGAGISIGVAVAAAVAPSLRAARLAPAAAMRADPVTALVRGRRSAVERIVPLGLWGRLNLATATKTLG